MSSKSKEVSDGRIDRNNKASLRSENNRQNRYDEEQGGGWQSWKAKKKHPKPTTAATNALQSYKAKVKSIEAELKLLKSENDTYSDEIKEKDALIKSQGASLSRYKQLTNTNLQRALDTANARIVVLEGKNSANAATIRSYEKIIKDYERIKRKYEETKDDLGEQKIKVAELQAQLNIYVAKEKQATALKVMKEKAIATGKEQRREKELLASLKAKEAANKYYWMEQSKQ